MASIHYFSHSLIAPHSETVINCLQHDIVKSNTKFYFLIIPFKGLAILISVFRLYLVLSIEKKHLF